MKNKIILVRKFGSEYKKIGEMKFKDEDSIARYNKKHSKHSIIIPPKNPFTLSTNKENILIFDLDNKQYIKFETVDLGLSTKFLDKLLNQDMIKQLVRAVKSASQETKTNWDFMKWAIALSVSFIAGYVTGVGIF